MKKALDQRVTLQDLKIDLRANLIKPLYASWLMMAMSTLQDRSDVVLRAFEKSGILEYLT